MENVTFDALKTAVVVLVAICGVIATVGKAADVVRAVIRRKAQKDEKQSAEIGENGKKLDKDKKRLDEHERAIEGLKCGQVHLCEGVQALLDHALHNGNSAQMQKASDNLDEWLRVAAAGKDGKIV